ncbi:MAG: hypothetical protein CMM50_01560 [Rhodospirillaceae bacterium]|nr:hypothetical protein [Rhodospirillaceae bacterium]
MLRGPTLDRFSSKFLWNLDWNLLKVFSVIAASGGVSRAAAVMSRQQPSVSSALKRLEDHVGATLCRRGPGGFELTEEGRLLAEICAGVEQQLSSLPGSFDALSSSVMFQMRLIMVGNLVSPQLDRALANFSRRYPRAELLVNVAPCTEIAARVLNHEVEIGVGPIDEHDERLETRILYREQHVLLCSPNHPLYGKVFKDPADLAKEAFVLPHNDEAAPIIGYRRRYGWGSVVAGESPDLNEVRRMLMAGLGIALLPFEYLEGDITAGRLHLLMEPDPELQDDILVVTDPRSPRRHAVARFLDLLDEE